jgi:glucokinase
MDTNVKVLVADVGGTNARLAVATVDTATNNVAIDAFRALRGADFADLPSLIESYLRDLNVPRPTQACFAIAGPIQGPPQAQVGTLTNVGWKADALALALRFQWQSVRLLNDFGALANSVPYLSADELITVREASAAQGPISVIGPGTGFGVALLVANNGGWQVITTEGGHRSFAPTTPRELQLYKQLGGDEKHLSAENLLSGAGIATIYQALAVISGSSARALEPDQISRHALDGTDPLCVETMMLFCDILGSVSGDTALIHGATGGVYLGGGIAPKIRPLLLNSRFKERFRDKGAMTAYLDRIPVFMIESQYAALKGAALWFVQNRA